MNITGQCKKEGFTFNAVNLIIHLFHSIHDHIAEIRNTYGGAISDLPLPASLLLVKRLFSMPTNDLNAFDICRNLGGFFPSGLILSRCGQLYGSPHVHPARTLNKQPLFYK